MLEAAIAHASARLARSRQPGGREGAGLPTYSHLSSASIQTSGVEAGDTQQSLSGVGGAYAAGSAVGSAAGSARSSRDTGSLYGTASLVRAVSAPDTLGAEGGGGGDGGPGSGSGRRGQPRTPRSKGKVQHSASLIA